MTLEKDSEMPEIQYPYIYYETEAILLHGHTQTCGSSTRNHHVHAHMHTYTRGLYTCSLGTDTLFSKRSKAQSTGFKGEFSNKALYCYEVLFYTPLGILL